MKVIAIGDIHGKSDWKSVMKTQPFDKFIFIGDYFDASTISATKQMANFRQIIKFKKKEPERVVLLFGNHDLQYLPAALAAGEEYSGFQERAAPRISQLIQENLPLMQMCYQWETFLFTHAGVTETWLRNAGYREGSVEVFINTLFLKQPEKFFFDGWDLRGDNVTQPPTWVRPASLQNDAYSKATLRQVVGHTKVQQLQILQEKFFFIDTLNASREYLIIEEGEVRIGTVA